MQSLLRALPESECAYLTLARPTVLDWDCESGDGTEEIRRAFPGVRLCGVGLTAGAVERASATHRGIEFLRLSERGIPRDFDVIIAAGRVQREHLTPEIVSNQLKRCRMLYAVLVPAIASRLRATHESPFPAQLGNFKQICAAAAPRDSVLLIYASPEYAASRHHWESVAAERRKWSAYYQNLDQEEPAELVEFDEELRAYVERLLPNGGRILEAGCGSGWQSLALARSGRFEANLLDFSPAALEASRRTFERAGIHAAFTLEDVFAEGKREFDLVFNAGVIEHYPFDRQVELLRGMASRSRKYVVCLAPNRHCYWYWISRVRNAAAANWPFGKESPLIDFRAVFEAAGLGNGCAT
jgi:SAM-dependent methyltransferase